MIKSMTGYGKAEAAADGKKITVEIRSLNGKQLDLSVKMPVAYRQFEYEIRNRVAKTVQRGKADVYITVESTAEASPVNIDKSLFRAYYTALRELGTELGCDGRAIDPALVSSILRLPDVVAVQQNAVSDNERESLLSAVDAALEAFEQFRIQEGQTLIGDLLKRIGIIEGLRRDVEPFETRRVEAIRQRILDGIASIGVAVDANRLEQEMIFYIEKLDVTEEKVRLDNHCRYFREVAASEENAGRKLGFIAQEMGREINTLGSKSNDSDMQKIVVRMKDELEKIKEQVLNIL